MNSWRNGRAGARAIGAILLVYQRVIGAGLPLGHGFGDTGGLPQMNQVSDNYKYLLD